ncbi:MAG: MFS transporter [Bacteroidetes bacterium]|nr:MAG: MFS transporter [Bacteroidota bacterium]
MNMKLPYRYRVLILLFFLILITYLDRFCIALVGVEIKSEFNLTNGQFGWVVSAFALAYALFEIPSAVLGDRIGQRSVLIRIVLWWSLFTALTGLTTGFVSLIVVRFLFGMGEAGAFPNSSGVVSHWFPARETARSISSLFIGLNAGAAIAPLIVIPIAAAFGWRSSFFVNGFIGLVWVLVCFVWFKNNPSDVKKISKEERDYIEKERPFINRHQALSWKKALANPSLRALVIAFFCSQWGLFFFVSWMPVYLQEGRHFSKADVKIISSSLFIFGIAGSIFSGWLSDWMVKRKGLRFGRRFIGAFALGFLGISFFIDAITTNNTLAMVSLITGYLIFSFNGIVSFSVCLDLGGNSAGTVAGIMNFFGQIGSFFLGIVFGKVADYTHNFNASLYVLAFVLCTGSLFWLAVDPRKKVIAESGHLLELLKIKA